MLVRACQDTSFLYGIYLKQSNSPAAAAHAATMREPLYLTELLGFLKVTAALPPASPSEDSTNRLSSSKPHTSGFASGWEG